MADIVTKKLVPAGESVKTNWYHSRQYDGYKKVNKKHTLLGFKHERKGLDLRRNKAYMSWSYRVRNNFNEWMVTYDKTHRNHPSSGCGQFSLELSF